MAQVRSCKECGHTGPVDEFRKDTSVPSGYRDWCKKCCNREMAGRRKGLKETDPAKLKRLDKIANLRKYGINEAKYFEMLDEQSGLCAICKEPPSGRHGVLYIDHDHFTGDVRGLLCHHCNIAIGHVFENVDTLISMSNYLIERGAKQ